MRTLREPIERTLDQLRLFLGMPELRAMHVQTSPQLVPVLTGTIAGCEDKGRNASPMMTLLTPGSLSGGGWSERTAELVREYEDLRSAAREADVELPALPSGSAAQGLPGFATTLASIGRALREPLAGVILVIAPGENAAPLAADLGALLAQPGLAHARWIVVESSTDLRGPFQALGPRAMCFEALPDDAAMAAELRQRAEAAAAAPAGATGAGAAGCAGPGVPAPRRPHEGPGTSSEVLKQAIASKGIAPAHADPEVAKEVRVAVLRAMAAAASRDFVGAAEQFRAARDVCLGAGMAREAVVHEMMMASIAMSAAPETALGLFRSARDRASALGDATLVARAELGRAGAAFSLRRIPEAVEAYRVAGDRASESDPVMAIEAYRMCGQLLASARQEQHAAAIWQRAITLAEKTAPVARHGSAAPDVARALADVCERHGLRAQAASLRAQAVALEAPIDPAALHPSQVLPAPPAAGAE